jgi:hypothetical protein
MHPPDAMRRTTTRPEERKDRDRGPPAATATDPKAAFSGRRKAETDKRTAGERERERERGSGRREGESEKAEARRRCRW